jgi:hypothetical protein
MVKSKVNTTKKSTKQHQKKGYQFIGIGIVLLMLVSGVAGYYVNTWQSNLADAPNEARLTRINEIYENLKLDPIKYQPLSSEVFGDKRVYEWDSGRTYSSAQTYQYGANVDTAVAELRKSIEVTGFTYFDEPYPGSVFTQLHFKSAKNEFIRLSIESKPRFDALRNEILMNSSVQASTDMDPNAGPSTITIKVNLDDNNE